MNHCTPPNHPDLLGPLLGRCAHLARERIDARLSQGDSTLSQTHLLMHIHHMGGEVTQSHLTKFLRVKPSSANGLIERLEERGLIARSVSPQDARQRIIALTPAGNQVREQMEARFEEGEALLSKPFTPEETRILKDLLIRLAETLEEDRTK